MTLRHIIRIIRRDSLSLATNANLPYRFTGASSGKSPREETGTRIWTWYLQFRLPFCIFGRWLNDYAVRIQPYWWIFACSILVKTSRTAHRNPVEALRYE